MEGRPNVVWITVDSLRADHTTLAGYERDTTPNLQKIADEDEGVALPNTVSQAIWSLPSASSLLTGTYPSYHGTGLWNDVLPGDVPTIPERLSAAGYRTIGVSQNAYFNDSTDLDRGFDEFDWLTKTNLVRKSRLRDAGEFLLNLREHGGGYAAPPSEHRPSFLVRKLLEDRLSSLADDDDPFFLYAHTLGTHLPYSPPVAYRDRYADDVELPADEAAELAFELSQNHYDQTATGCDFTEREREALVAMYDALVRYVDQQLGELFSTFWSLDLDDTIFVVTADHGDLLGERGVLGHQLSLHDGLITVPAVCYGLPSLGEVDPDAPEQLDLMATVLNETGIDTDFSHGTDLREADATHALAQRGESTYRTALDQIRESNPEFDDSRYHDGLVHALRSREFKLVESDERTELFDLPDETTDVSEEYPDVLADHEAELERRLDAVGEGARTDQSREMSDELRRQLSDLGYVDG